MVAAAAGITPASDAFLVGMFSLLDALVHRPLSEVLVELNLPAAIRGPLLGTAGPTGVAAVYQIALRCEAGDWETLEELLKQLFLPAGKISELYIEAVNWANGMLSLVGPEPSTPATTPVPPGAEPRVSDFMAMNKALGPSTPVSSSVRPSSVRDGESVRAGGRLMRPLR